MWQHAATARNVGTVAWRDTTLFAWRFTPSFMHSHMVTSYNRSLGPIALHGLVHFLKTTGPSCTKVVSACFDCSSYVSTLLTVGWLVVSTPLKNISQLGWLFPIFGKIQFMFQSLPTSWPLYNSFLFFSDFDVVLSLWRRQFRSLETGGDFFTSSSIAM